MQITIGIVDDESLYTKGLSALIATFATFKVVVESVNGEDLLRRLDVSPDKPDILLIDVNMPRLDGLQVAQEVREKYPLIRMVALSLKDDDATIIRMIRAGCCAYLYKGIWPAELEKALLEVHNTGNYNADLSNLRARQLRQYEENQGNLTDKELHFIQLSCSDLTYKQIAVKMNLSARTIDGYRDSVFKKMNVESRVGMVLEALKRKLVNL